MERNYATATLCIEKTTIAPVLTANGRIAAVIPYVFLYFYRCPPPKIDPSPGDPGPTLTDGPTRVYNQTAPVSRLV